MAPTLFLVRLSNVEGREYPLEDGTGAWAREEEELCPRWFLLTEAEKAAMDEEIIPDDPNHYTRVMALKIEEPDLTEEELHTALLEAILSRREALNGEKGLRPFSPYGCDCTAASEGGEESYPYTPGGVLPEAPYGMEWRLELTPESLYTKREWYLRPVETVREKCLRAMRETEAEKRGGS
jgi:hypothetical protein